MATTQRISAFLAYLLLVIGSLYIFMFERHNKLAVFHAKQALLITLTALAIPLVWGVVAWLVSWLPFGFLFGIALFALVIAAYIFLVIIWLLGLLYVSQNQIKPLPVIGQWAKWLPIR